ncbi:MAG: tetratricopeptide repeat protein [candidate division WOR-3 bacterium]|nr:MAG: tetratricopeptide repeat protein [candidate division WOR-3 bacterium]
MSSVVILLLITVLPAKDYCRQVIFDEALRYYRVFLSTTPSYEVYYNAAICALASGNVDECVNLFKNVPRKKTEVDYYLGIAQYQRGLYDEAEEHFHSLLKKDKTLWQPYYYLGLVKLKQNKIEEALRYFDLVPDSEYKRRLVAYIAGYNQLIEAQEKFNQGLYDDAITLYEEIENLFGYRETGLALSYTKIGEYKKSLVLLDSVINYSTNKQIIGRCMLEAATICFSLKNYAKAQAYLKNYLSIMTSDAALFLLGKVYFSNAKHDSAALYFGLLPDSIDEYLFYKGRTDFFLGQWGNAERTLLRHREMFPHSSHGDRAIYILASINFARKEYSHAVEFWKELVEYHPHSVYAASALKKIGDTYFTLKDYKNALDAYRSVKHYRPASSIEEETSLKIYETLYYLGRYSSLISALRKFVEQNPRSTLVPKTRLRIAKMLFDRKYYNQALAELNNLIHDYPDTPLIHEALIERARVSRRTGNINEMKNSFHYLLQNRDAEEYYSYAANELGSIYFEESNYDSALYYYNLLLNFDTYREKAMLEVAKIYDVLGQHKEAETMIDKLITDFPASVFLFDAYTLKSKAYKKQGDYQKAITVLEDLMKKVGEKPEVYLEIGNTYFEIDDYENARTNFVRAGESFRQRRDEAAKALILAGDASIFLGDKKSAVDYYIQANMIAESPTLKGKATEKMSTITEE